MATRLILVPEPMYRGLVESSNQKLPTSTMDSNLGLDFVRQNLEKTKKKRIKNLSTKNILYNQELRRFLRLSKEARNKPIKVQLSNGLLIYPFYKMLINN
jgi:hypothetical protein